MSKQFTDGFDGYSLRKGDCRGERMPGEVERDLFLDTRLSNDLVEAFIAPPVAREFEYASGTRCGHIFQKDNPVKQLNKNVSLTSCKVRSSLSYCIIRVISSMVR